MDVLKTLARALLALSLIVGPAVASADPDDLDLESFTDDHPDGKKAAEEAKKKAEMTPEERAKEEAKEAADAEKRAREGYAQKENMFFVEEEAIVPDPAAAGNPDEQLCYSTKEYVDTLAFLRKTDLILLTETTSRRIADRVSRGCDGGAMRFIKVLGLLKSMGLSDRRAVQIGLVFSAKPAEVQRAFMEIFTKAYLAEFFDYDYGTAVELAFELSKNFRGDPKEAREDFLELVRFCKDGKKLDLPARMCAEFTIKVARLSQYYPNGVRGSFQKLYQHFRDDKKFLMDVKSALSLAYEILKFGPRAPANFFPAYDYAARADGLAMSHGEALQFGVKMAGRSFRGG